MIKIPTLFKRTFDDNHVVYIEPVVTPGFEWVLAGEGIATVKWDGSCCAVFGGQFFKRYDAKHGKPIGCHAAEKIRETNGSGQPMIIIWKPTISHPRILMGHTRQ